MTGCIIGWAHTPFGKLEGEDVESLVTSVAADAIKHSGLEPKDIDAVYLGHFNGGFAAQDFTASLALHTDPALRFKPATRLENACATGSAAIHGALNAIDAKQHKRILVVGVEKMTDTPKEKIGEYLLRASYVKEEGEIEGGFAGQFGRIAELYFQKHGNQMEALAKIASKNHKNGCKNPYAQLRKDLDVEFCNTVSEKNPIVAGPLRRTDCSLVSDGAAAVIITDVDTALSAERAIIFRAKSHAQDILPMSKRDMTHLEGVEVAWAQALEAAKLGLFDLDFVETHDCFTIAELMEYEAMGLAKPGEGYKVLEEGIPYMDGKLPINPSGGLKAKGHPVGATGVSMHAITAMQLSGEAGDMQVKDASKAGIFNMGGAAVANYVSILERLR